MTNEYEKNLHIVYVRVWDVKVTLKIKQSVDWEYVSKS